MAQRNDDGTDWLDGIGIASPCSANWNEMSGDDRCRFCEHCSLHVFDLSAMTRQDAVALVKDRTGKRERLCVRFTRRADGTVLTQDCPVGLRQRLRRTASRLVAMCAAAFAFLGCRGERAVQGGDGATTGIVAPQPVQGDVLGEIDRHHELQGRIVAPQVIEVLNGTKKQ